MFERVMDLVLAIAVGVMIGMQRTIVTRPNKLPPQPVDPQFVWHCAPAVKEADDPMDHFVCLPPSDQMDRHSGHEGDNR